MLDFLAYGNFLSDIVTVADDVTYLYYENYYRCRLMSPIYKIGRHCRVKVDCDIGTLMLNLFQKHVIETVGSLSMIAANSLELSFDTDARTIHDLMFTYGKNIGNLVADLFDIHGVKQKDLEDHPDDEPDS